MQQSPLILPATDQSRRLTLMAQADRLRTELIKLAPTHFAKVERTRPIIIEDPLAELLDLEDAGRDYCHQRGRYPLDPELLAELLDESLCGPSLSDYVMPFLRSGRRGEKEYAWDRVLALARIVGDFLCDEQGLPRRCFKGSCDLGALCVVLSLPARLLHPQLAFAYLQLSYTWSDGRRGPQVSANSYMKQARNIFQADMLDHFAALGLPPLPGLVGFCSAKLIKIGPPVHESISAEHFEGMLADLPALCLREPEVAVFILLILFAGLRANEARHARRAWLSDSRSGLLSPHGVHVRREHGFRPKFGHARRAPISAGVAALLQRLAGEQEYLVSDNPSSRAGAYERAKEWLRAHQSDPNKPVQDMRRIYLSAMASLFGFEEARLAGGHGSANTTFKCYLLGGFNRAMAQRWREHQAIPLALEMLQAHPVARQLPLSY